MNRAKRVLSAAWIGLAVAGVAVAADAQSRRESYADRYGALSEHNIFVRDRTIKPEPPKPKTTQPSRTPEASLVLRGVVLEDDEIRAYIEDLSNSKMMKLSPGETVGRGRIAEVGIDAIAYERSGEQVWINIGADFTGKQVVTITSAASATTEPIEAIDPNRTDLTMEEKLKLRRQQERSGR